MKGYKRRLLGKPDFWKVAYWDDLIGCWRDGKKQFDTQDQARCSITTTGKYRLSFIPDGKPRIDMEILHV
jgi:hypothetical protein